MQIKAHDWEIEIESSAHILLSDEHLSEMLKLLSDLQSAANMEEFNFVKRVDGKFDYEFKSFDGREWNQVIDVTNHADYSMIFNTDDWWKLSEFTPHRPLRDHVVKMAHDFQLEWIKVKFTA